MLLAVCVHFLVFYSNTQTKIQMTETVTKSLSLFRRLTQCSAMPRKRNFMTWNSHIIVIIILLITIRAQLITHIVAQRNVIFTIIINTISLKSGESVLVTISIAKAVRDIIRTASSIKISISSPGDALEDSTRNKLNSNRRRTAGARQFVYTVCTESDLGVSLLEVSCMSNF